MNGYDAIRNFYAQSMYERQQRIAAAQAEHRKVYGREYLGSLLLSDTVTVPYGRDFYQRHASEENSGVTLEIDDRGEHSGRKMPPEGFIYALVHGPAESQFWDRVVEEINDTREETDGGSVWDLSDEHIKVYGAPVGAEEA